MRAILPLCAFLLFSACPGSAPDEPPAANAEVFAGEPPVETRARTIELAGPLSHRAAEISGLTWYGDTLVILPQYPSRFQIDVDTIDVSVRDGEAGALFALTRTEIEAYLDASLPAPLRPWAIPFETPGVEERILGFEGYEAIAFRDGRVYVAIEFEHEADIQGFLIAGTVAPGLASVRLDPASLRALPSQTRIGNLSYETLLLVPEGIVALQEANGREVNPTPEAYVFDETLAMRDSLALPNVEYRLTDATSLDARGRFWALNYFFPGERDILLPGPDSLSLVHGTGATHRQFDTVERLVEMQYAGDRIARTNRPPIQLELLGDDRPRNWEGIARLGDRGFLVATDKFPETLLAFVPAPPSPRLVPSEPTAPEAPVRAGTVPERRP